MLRYTIDRARPGLVAFYDIRPGNRAGLFLQPWNMHRADKLAKQVPECQSILDCAGGTVVTTGELKPNHRYHNTNAQFFC